MWYQLLVGDVTREMAHGWARELEVKFALPREQIALIERCVGWIEERPRDAGDLLGSLRSLPERQGKVAAAEPLPAVDLAVPTPSSQPSLPAAPSTQESERSRQLRFVIMLRQLLECHKEVARTRAEGGCVSVVGLPASLALGCILGGVIGGAVERSTGSTLLAVLVAVTAGGSVLGLLIGLWSWLGRKVPDRARRRRQTRIEALLGEFPQECQTWGGRAALADREMVQAILRDLEAPQPRRD
jgi:hypothetical protein